MTETEWRPLAVAHQQRVDQITQSARQRRRQSEPHPIEDFIWNYYRLRPYQLRRWHPGFGVQLIAAAEYQNYRGYQVESNGAAQVSAEFVQTRIPAWRNIRKLLQATASRPAKFGCYGLHEWAMVYQLEQSEVRHEQAPLRLSPKKIAAVIESSNIQCTHFDAYRFFTSAAAPLNQHALSRDSQIDFEQPGCIHANMDLYKWTYKLLPAISSEFLMACFSLTLKLRELDMRAAPYDLTNWGLSPIEIETTQGRAEYLKNQRELAGQAERLRQELVDYLIEIEAVSTNLTVRNIA